MNTADIHISNLSFAYREQTKPLLSIADLEIKSGEKVFIYGPSGSGKSTLLGLLSGTLSTDTGSIRIEQHSLTTMTSAQRDHFRGSFVGYIFQIFNLIPYLNVYENILLPIQINPTKKSRLQKSPKDTIVNLAKRLGIDDILDKPVTDISVGQQQRVAAARAFIGDPPLIIADEPTSSLDNDHRQLFCKLLLEEAERYGATVLFVSHDTSLKDIFDRSIDLTTLTP